VDEDSGEVDRAEPAERNDGVHFEIFAAGRVSDLLEEAFERRLLSVSDGNHHEQRSLPRAAVQLRGFDVLLRRDRRHVARDALRFAGLVRATSGHGHLGRRMGRKRQSGDGGIGRRDRFEGNSTHGGYSSTVTEFSQ
jgi:hypothetical protein